MRAAIFAFCFSLCQIQFLLCAVRFESQLLNGGKCQDRQIRDSCAALNSEEKADHLWRGTQWQLASGEWVCGAQRRCTSAKTFHFVAAAAGLAAISRSCRSHSQVP